MKNNTITLVISGSGAMTGTNTITSDPIPVEQLWAYAIQAVWTGTPNGTLKLQASCDAPDKAVQASNGGPYTVTNWTDISGSSNSVTGSAGSFMWNVSDVGYRFVRLSYTNSSSSGTLTAKASLKGI